MNLYIFYESSRGAVYGIGTYIRELTVALVHCRINVTVVHIRSDKTKIQKEEIEGICHWYFPEPIREQRTTDYKKQNELYYINIVYLLRLRIEDKRELIFHLNSNRYGSLADLLKKTFECRVITVVHYSDWGFSIYDNLPRLRTKLSDEKPNVFGVYLKKSFEEEKSLYSKMDRVICLSQYMMEILIHNYWIDASKIFFIPNGLTDVVNARLGVEILRKKWKAPLKEKIILFVGRMDDVKGVEYLIKAFREVLQVYPKCRLVIAGSGSYDKYIKESQDICTKVTYTGFLDKEHLYEWYQLTDVGIIPSLFEPFGYVAVEMMMHSLPVVATATSGLNEVVDNTCGLKVPLTVLPENVEIDISLLAETILYLLKHPREARIMGRNGRKRYLKEYSSEVFRKNMLNFYTSLYDS